MADMSLSIEHLGKNIEQLGKNIQDLTNNFSRLESRFATLSDKLDTKVATLSQKLDVLHSLHRMSAAFPDRQVAKSASPRTLTDYGTKLSLEIDAPSLAAHYALSLREKIGSMDAWQIQELCFNHAEHEIMNDLQEHDIDRYNQIIMCAYREGIDLSQVMRVVGLVMRDQLLQQTGQLPRVQTASSFPGDYDPWNSASFAGQTANPNNPKK